MSMQPGDAENRIRMPANNIRDQVARSDDDYEGDSHMIVSVWGKGMIESQTTLLLPMMNSYLTDVWKMSFTKAALILNLWEGGSSILPLVLAYASEIFLSTGLAYAVSSIFCTTGLGFLSMSTPPVLSKHTGTCSYYQPECIGQTQRILFFTSVVLIAVGIAGFNFIIGEYVDNSRPATQGTERTPKKSKGFEMFCRMCFSGNILLSSVIAGIIFSYIKPWSVRFGVLAIISAVSTCYSMPCIVFCCLIMSEENKQEQENENRLRAPLTSVIRVFVAAALKRSQRLPNEPAHFYNEKNTSRTPGLKCLEKAAIILPNKSLEEQKKNRWKLCSISEVEEAKIAVRFVPMSMTFVFCGVITSIGNTYFLEQAKHLNQKIGHLKLPLLFLPLLHKLMKSLFANTIPKYITPRHPQYSIALGMISSVVCCITAALVEHRRLHNVVSHSLLDKPDKRISMSVLWLVPQFVLLAANDSLLEKGVVRLFLDHMSQSSKKYLTCFARGISGAGIAGGVLSVYVVGKASERGGKANWFQSTLNQSRLDKYYWTLAALGAGNLVLYIVAVLSNLSSLRGPKKADAKEDPEADVARDDVVDLL